MDHDGTICGVSASVAVTRVAIARRIVEWSSGGMVALVESGVVQMSQPVNPSTRQPVNPSSVSASEPTPTSGRRPGVGNPQNATRYPCGSPMIDISPLDLITSVIGLETVLS